MMHAIVKVLGRLLLLFLLAAFALVGFAYWTAVSDPVVRTTRLELLPPGSPGKQLRILADFRHPRCRA